jgi:hypothetical protein
MKLELSHDEGKWRRWKVVRLDTYTDVPGEIVTADDASGECMMNIAGEKKTLSFACGIKIVPKARHVVR